MNKTYPFKNPHRPWMQEKNVKTGIKERLNGKKEN